MCVCGYNQAGKCRGELTGERGKWPGGGGAGLGGGGGGVA